MKFVVFCPIFNTGGPFALFQLHDAIRQLGAETEIVFFSHAKLGVSGDECRVTYKEDMKPVKMANITPQVCHRFKKDDILIFPEIRLDLMMRFHERGFKNTVYWWLSWNNAPINMVERLDHYRCLSQCRHLFQSSYAKSKVGELGWDGLLVSDYTLYDEAAAATPAVKKHDLCYMGRKASGAESIMEELSKSFNVVRVENMSQNQVTTVLRETTFFLDFGMQPGKDRMPREAIMYGCIPIVRRVGAAVNNDDVPLPLKLKPSTENMLKAGYLKDLIHSLKPRFNDAIGSLDHYRIAIQDERKVFFEEVQNFVEVCKRN